MFVFGWIINTLLIKNTQRNEVTQDYLSQSGLYHQNVYDNKKKTNNQYGCVGQIMNTLFTSSFLYVIILVRVMLMLRYCNLKFIKKFCLLI
jgi:hypothetical protein